MKKRDSFFINKKINDPHKPKSPLIKNTKINERQDKQDKQEKQEKQENKREENKNERLKKRIAEIELERGFKKTKKIESQPQTENTNSEMPFKTLKKAIKQKEGRSAYTKPSQSFIMSESKRVREFQKGRDSGAPTEMSSKIPVPRRRVVIPVQKKKVSVDPRFRESPEEFDQVYFSKNYSFIRDIEDRELTELNENFGRDDIDEEDKSKISHAINIMKAKHDKERRALELQQLKSELRKKEIQKVAETGKTPYFYSDAELKKIQREKKYNELVENGKLDSYMKKKLKKKARRREDSQKKFMKNVG